MGIFTSRSRWVLGKVPNRQPSAPRSFKCHSNEFLSLFSLFPDVPRPQHRRLLPAAAGRVPPDPDPGHEAGPRHQAAQGRQGEGQDHQRRVKKGAKF